MPKKPLEVRALAAALNCTPRSTTLDPRSRNQDLQPQSRRPPLLCRLAARL